MMSAKDTAGGKIEKFLDFCDLKEVFDEGYP